MMLLKFASFAFAVLVVAKSSTQASQDSLGPNGINSLVTGLEGTGIAIGQVEPSRPGLRPLFGGFDDPAHSGTTTDPELVAILETPVAAAFANIGVNDHAQRVAGIMISTHETATGVAPLASLYASAFLTPPPSQPQIALTAQFVALQAQGNVRAINFSFGHPLNDGDDLLDGNLLLPQFMDWSSRVHDVLYVRAGNETNTTARTPVGSEDFNGMTVAFSEKNADGVYRNIPIDNPGVTTGNVFTEDAFGDRTSIDIVAPGRNIETIQLGDTLNTNSGTSYAAPHVTGTVALLQQYGDERILDANSPQWNANGNARRHEVMKAVLMNSADKIKEGSITQYNGVDIPAGGLLGMERTTLDSNNQDWFASEANDDTDGDIPLDDQMGVGHLNAKRALEQFSTGEYNESNTVDVPVIGWDYGTTTGLTNTQPDINRYRFNETLKGGSFISITLAWDRVVKFDQDGGDVGRYDEGDTFASYLDTDSPGELPGDSVINDLDIFFQLRGAPSINASLAESSSREGNIEHLFFQVPADGEYEFWVRQHDIEPDVGNNQNYGVAWWAMSAAEPTLGGDFNGDGMVDGADLAQWRGDFGPIDNGSDADGDGDSDGADFLAWQRNLGSSAATSTAGAVPEPAAWVLGAICLTFFAWRRNGFDAKPK